VGWTCGTHGEGRGAYRVLFWRSDGKRPLGRPRRRWEDNIKMDFKEMGIDGANWIRLAQDRVRWRAFMDTLMNLWVSAPWINNNNNDSWGTQSVK